MVTVLEGAFGLIIGVAVIAVFVDASREPARLRSKAEAAKLRRRDRVEKELQQRIMALRKRL